MRRLASITLALMALTALPSGAPTFGAHAATRTATPNAVPKAVPPECVLKTPYKPWLVPVWAFVLNFDVIKMRPSGAQYPVGCLVIWRVPFTPTDYITVDTCDTTGAIKLGGGEAFFSGGDVRCRLDLLSTFKTLTPTFTITVEQTYSTMQLVGVGRIAPPTTPDPNSNPVMYYRPDLATAKPVGLFVPTDATTTSGDVYTIRSDFAGITNLGPRMSAGQGNQIWSVKQVPATHELVHELNWTTPQTFKAQPPVVLRMDAATLYVGGSPLGPGFDGTLDEVIFDPADAIGPSSTGSSAVWVPIVNR